jgi:hypothetical protein
MSTGLSAGIVSRGGAVSAITLCCGAAWLRCSPMPLGEHVRRSDQRDGRLEFVVPPGDEGESVSLLVIVKISDPIDN